jgi:hypothetical protein
VNVTSFQTKGTGWSVYDLDRRVRIAGPWKGKNASGRAQAIERDLRAVKPGDEGAVKAILAKHGAP